MDYHPIQGEAILVASCYRKKALLRPCGPPVAYLNRSCGLPVPKPLKFLLFPKMTSNYKKTKAGRKYKILTT